MGNAISKLLKSITGTKRKRRRKTGDASRFVTFLESSRLIASLIFIFTVAAIVFISFVGVSNSSLPVLPNQLSSVRIVASTSFSYPSTEKTNLLREQIRDRVPPVYRIETAPLKQFEAKLKDLHAAIDQTVAEPGPASSALLDEAVQRFNQNNPFGISTSDLSPLIKEPDPAVREKWFDTGLDILSGIYARGIHDDTALSTAGPGNQMTVFRVAGENGETTSATVDTREEAIAFLRLSLNAESIKSDISASLFRIFRCGIETNLVYDREATEARQQQVLRSLKPVIVQVEKGQTIIEPDTRVTPEQYEMLVAHRQHLIDNTGYQTNELLHLFGRLLLVLAMIVASLLYIKLEDPETMHSNGRLGLLALVVIVNLAMVRTTYALGDLPFFLENTNLASLLPYIAPVYIAPLIVAIMIDAGSAIFMALLISIFTSVIYGNRLDLLVLNFLASMAAIVLAQQTRRRGSVVRAASLGGSALAIFVLLLGIVDRLPPRLVFQQMIAGIGTGIICGVIVAGLLPLLEGLFKRTTDITLLELTDYNHPLLRKMQIEAPGTYHHSLVVAQLSENAASAIGANPLLARVCALFHDIGKTLKPEYFIENQRDGFNPHDDNNPSLSALIIKSHVKDGVDLALKHKLPRAVIDVIKQHHGTSLIRYFYHRARQSLRAPATSTTPTLVPFATETVHESPDNYLPGLNPVPVSENTYRYDGPIPRFKESAIIHLADGVEAASRSMKKVTPQHLAELIEQIFRDRISDHQLDEAPITFAELDKIKDSFAHTLLNMLHGRIAYPDAKPAKTEEPKDSKPPVTTSSRPPFSPPPAAEPSPPPPSA